MNPPKGLLNSIPKVSRELIDYLEVIYKDKAPNTPHVDMKDVMFNAGSVSVVRLLRSHYDTQHKTILKG